MTTDVASPTADQDDPVVKARERRVSTNLAELADLTEKLAPVDDWHKRRSELLLALRADEVPYAVIAEHYGGSAEAARVAVNKARKARAGRPKTRKAGKAPG